MANKTPKEENLTPFNKMDSDRAVEIRRKGGKASQKVLKKKRDLREKIQLAIDILTEQQLKNKSLSREQRELIESTDVIIYDLITIAVNPKVKTEARLKAKDMILDRLYGKPKQEIKATNTNINSDINLEDFSDDALKKLSEMSNEEISTVLNSLDSKAPKPKPKAKKKIKKKTKAKTTKPRKVKA